MSQSTYNYSKSSDFIDGKVNLGSLELAVKNSNITIVLDWLSLEGDVLSFVFRSQISSAEANILDSIVSSHNAEPLPNPVETINVQEVYKGDYVNFKNSNDVDLNSSYSELHSVMGSGSFFGAAFVVDNDDIECKVEIDGGVLFEFKGSFLKEVVNADSDNTASGMFGCSSDGKKLFFNPKSPIAYSSSLVFSARSSKNNKSVKYQLYTYTVE